MLVYVAVRCRSVLLHRHGVGHTPSLHHQLKHHPHRTNVTACLRIHLQYHVEVFHHCIHRPLSKEVIHDRQRWRHREAEVARVHLSDAVRVRADPRTNSETELAHGRLYNVRVHLGPLHHREAEPVQGRLSDDGKVHLDPLHRNLVPDHQNRWVDVDLLDPRRRLARVIRHHLDHLQR